ncbi:TetR/AcrR family transcriptional regulator [Deinococcus sp. QL22]|uniref:TetR/AcrR family transcriptional regulator n=1 Tax=Deinococcus sp. QL22 TaxID=2939437 RepID=UPI002018163E|nr:TetR/AcrR family transcriptional regulator [Deinococcus sp. QL22]UQN08504.1 TetR/AcrR family transcriptional regulator [Deinococcus sp. QL22]
MLAAARVFLEEGFEAATTNRIAETAGVSVGSLYQFFPNKTALLSELQIIWTQRLGAELDVALAYPHRPVVELIDEVLGVHARLQRESGGLLGFLLTNSPTGDPSLTVRRAIQERLEHMALMRRPESLPEHNRLLARMTIHISDALYTLAPDAASDPHVRQQVRMALLGYLKTTLEDIPQEGSSPR